MEANSVLPAFSRALQSFRSRLTQQDIDRFRTTSLQNLKDSISSIQTEQAGRQGLRNLSKIRPFLTGLEQYSRVIEVFVNADPLILAFIWVDKIYSHHCLNKVLIAVTGSYKVLSSSTIFSGHIDVLEFVQYTAK